MKRLCEIILAGGFFLSACALGADYAGVVKIVQGDAYAERASARVSLAPGTHLLQGDRLVTGANGRIGVTMRDDTLLTLGPNGLLALDTYAFDAKTHDGNFLASLTRGVLSVVTGLIAKRSPESFVVKTRISTMGVRGTEFIIEANEL